MNANAERIILRTGGWKTVTTKTRMNQAASEFNLGFMVSQEDYAWFVRYGDKVLPFEGNEFVIPRT